MKTRNLFAWLTCSMLFCLLAACGPAPLTDLEFTEAAQDTCQVLKTEITALPQIDFQGKSEAYRKAAAKLDELTITEKSAPQGLRLRTGLVAMADAQESFAAALETALEKTELKTPALLFITEDGNAYASPGSIFEMSKLDIDPTLGLAVNTQTSELRDAAAALGLEACAPEQPDEE